MTRYGGALPELAKQGLGLSFCTQNAQKNCVELDLKDPEQLAQVLSSQRRPMYLYRTSARVWRSAWALVGTCWQK